MTPKQFERDFLSLDSTLNNLPFAVYILLNFPHYSTFSQKNVFAMHNSGPLLFTSLCFYSPRSASLTFLINKMFRVAGYAVSNKNVCGCECLRMMEEKGTSAVCSSEDGKLVCG